MKVDVLLSWSGKQSREAALLFHEWIPKILPEIKPWHSKIDISKGTRWFNELQVYLERARACIVFVTSENIRSPWIFWETGALSAAKRDQGPLDKQVEPLIIPLLINVPTTTVENTPFANYQYAPAAKEDIRLIVEALNDLVEFPLDDNSLRGVFEKSWDELEQRLAEITRRAMPYNIVELLDTVNELLARFEKEWPAAEKADGAEPAKHLLTEFKDNLDAIWHKEGIGEREKNFIKILYGRVYDANNVSRQAERVKRAKEIPKALGKLIGEIESAYE